MKEKLLLLGGNGFLGTHLCNYFKSAYADYFELFLAGRRNVSDGQNNYIKADLLDIAEMEMLITRISPSYIINLAGLNYVDVLENGINTNVILSQNILEIVRKNPQLYIKKILLVGSAAEYGNNKQLPLKEDCELNPINFYGLSKSFQTQCALFYYRTYNIPVIIARTFNVIGINAPKTSAIGAFLEKIRSAPNDGDIQVGNISMKRDYLDADDVIEAYFTILLKGVEGQIYNVCSNKLTLMKDILEGMIFLSGKKLSIKSTDKTASTEILNSCGDNTKLKKLGWHERFSMEQSIFKLFN